ncbi:hypothetical protein ILUMI_13536 [Ignelater luminosus]|uniref:Uncharacterized protein n=1 Tax=Ignelater luminosus TaxID=2038154 RepID=A0A8K0CWI9_IGNLU|nr:hypothetical protein ILUMI_13536 [Ignelater luminosus]
MKLFQPHQPTLKDELEDRSTQEEYEIKLLEDEDDIYRFQNTAGENIEDRPSDECVEIGQNVLVKISDVKRGRLAPRNILAVVLSEREDLYQLGTSTEMLKKLYASNEFQPSQTTTLAFLDIPFDEKFSFRTVAAKESNSAQGLLRCNCRKQCGDKKCKCVLNQMKCNSKCHSSTSCLNKSCI